MLLEPLISVIETVKERISAHGNVLRENETRTRMALIDPLLQGLGWDVSDPAVVLPEYDVSGRKADYALLGDNGSPSATLEAKKLGESLASHRMQMLNYSNASGVEFAGLTDGDKWELYEVFKRGQLEERRVLDISIANTSPHEAALKLLLLWRPNLASGRPSVAASAPVLAQQPQPTPPSASAAPHHPASVATPQPADDTGNWISLAEITTVTGQQPPIAVKFSDGQVQQIKYWWELLWAVSESLVKDGKLTAAHCPIPGIGFINSAPVGPNGRHFGKYREVPGGLYLNVNLNADTVVRHSKTLLTHFGVDPATVHLRFA